MKSIRGCSLVLSVMLAFSPKPALADTAPSPDDDEALLRDAGVDTDTGLLLTYLRGQALTHLDAGQVKRLVQRLGSERASERELATQECVRLGKFTREELKRTSTDKDPEVAGRAKECLRQIERHKQLGVIRVAVRVLVKRRQTGAVDVLLKLLPDAEADESEAELYYGLETLGVDKAGVAPALLKALADQSPAQRAVAACIIGWRGNTEQRAAVRKLLTDRSAVVRLRAAQGLLAGGGKTGLPALISLLAERDVTLAWQAEELLRWAAGKTAPAAVLGTASAEERRRCREAWQIWQGKYAAGVDLAERRKDGRRPGLLLLFYSDNHYRPWRELVWLRGCDGTTRWQWKGPAKRVQFLPSNRVLLSEFRPDTPQLIQVTERDLNGKILWREGSRNIRVAYRLRDGHTLFHEGGEVYEVNEAGQRIGKDWPRVSDPDALNYTSYGYSEGLLARGRFTWWGRGVKTHRAAEIDLTTGRCRRSFTLPDDPKDNLRAIGVTDRGHFFLNHYSASKNQTEVLELDTAGKIIWRYRMSAWSAERLANGNVILTTANLVFGMPAVVEVDRAGRKVWEDFPPRVTHRVQVCLPLVRFGFDQPADAPLDLDSLAYRLQGLKDKDPEVRYRSATMLKQLGAKAVPALRAMLEAQAGMGAEQRRFVQEVAMKLADQSSWPILLKAAKHRSPEVRAAAIELFFKYPDQARAVVPVLLAALKDGSVLVRRTGAIQGGNFLQEKEVVLALINALHDDDRAKDYREGSVSQYAANSLGCGGPHAKLAATALTDAVQNPRLQHIRPAVILNLGYLARREQGLAPTLVSRLAMILKDTKEKGRNRATAAHALSGLGPKAKAAVPVLRAMIIDQEAKDYDSAMQIRYNSLSALSGIGPGASAAVPELLLVLNNPRAHPAHRSAAAGALGEIGPAAQAAIQSLARIKSDTSLPPSLRTVAGAALRKILAHPPGGR